jgi:hypothetical protein
MHTLPEGPARKAADLNAELMVAKGASAAAAAAGTSGAATGDTAARTTSCSGTAGSTGSGSEHADDSDDADWLAGTGQDAELEGEYANPRDAMLMRDFFQ